MKVSRPILLYVLAALSAIYIFFNIYQEMVYLTEKTYFTGEEYFEKQAETMADLDPEDDSVPSIWLRSFGDEELCALWELLPQQYKEHC